MLAEEFTERLIRPRHDQNKVILPFSSIKNRDNVCLARNGLKQQFSGRARRFRNKLHDRFRVVLCHRREDSTKATLSNPIT
jgi:hypothetical protein